jgi:glycosyltransferase involved in cell wall biosynthesis/GT2 family glycosyltransferase
MRVLLVNKYAHVTGGADRQCLALARALREHGHEVAFLSSASTKNVEHEGLFIPASVTHDTRDALPVPRQAEAARLAIWNREAAAATRRLVSDFRPDVVHAHKLYPQLSVAPIVVARRYGIPVVQTLHDYEFMAANPLDAEGGKVDKREPRLSFRALNTATFVVRRRLHVPAVTKWIAVSDFVARAHRAHGIESRVVVNFADVDETLAPLDADARNGVLFLGALTEEKGLPHVLRVARDLSHLRVVIAGRGPLESVVVDQAEKQANLEFRGFLEPSRALEAVRSAQILVVPSRWEEPGGLVALEAMAAGTPIVAYRRGGLSEYVSMSGAGLIVDPNSHDLEAACRSLLMDHSLWERCSKFGREATTTIFSRASHLDAVIDVYEDAMHFGRAPNGRVREAHRESTRSVSGRIRPRASVLIPTHEDAFLLKKSLPALLSRSDPDIEVVILNNDPSQDVGACIGSLADDSRVKIIEMGFEAGFSRAINRGVHETTGEFVLLCNADLFPSETYVKEIVAFFDENPRAGAAIGKLLRYDLREDRPTDLIDSAGLFLTRQRRVMPRGEGTQDLGQFDQACEVFALDGAAIVLRRAALQAISVDGEYLDESFVMHKEDHDVSWRLRLAGWECWYVPRAVAYHGRTTRGLGTTKYLSAVRSFHRNENEKSYPVRTHAMKNQWLMLLKNEDAHNFVRDFPFIFGRESLVVAHNLFTAPRTLVAIPMTLKAVPSTLRKRRIAKANQTMDPRALRRWLSIRP